MTYAAQLSREHRERMERLHPLIPIMKKNVVTLREEQEPLPPPAPVEPKEPVDLSRVEARLAALEWRVTLLMQKVIRKPADKPVGERVTVTEIRDAVCLFFDITKDDLDSQCRDAKSVRPRHIGIYLTRKLTPRGFPFIARAFNRHDHSTAVNAFQRITDLMLDDETLRDEITAITELIMQGREKQERSDAEAR